jgi:hypothetical protein
MGKGRGQLPKHTTEVLAIRCLNPKRGHSPLRRPVWCHAIRVDSRTPGSVLESTSLRPGANDLRFATNEERRYVLAYLRWLAGGPKRRGTQPSATHHTYALTPERGEQIRGDIEQLVLDAAKHLCQRS